MFFDVILIAGIVTIIFIMLFLFRKKKEQSSIFLLTIFFVVFVSLVNFYANVHNVKYLIRITGFIIEGAGYLLAPLFYFYTLSLFKTIKLSRINTIAHFFPFLLNIICITIPLMVSNFYDGNTSEYLKFIKSIWEELFVLESFYFLIYILKAFQKLQKHQKIVKSYYSNLDMKNFSWAKQMLICLIAYQVINIGLSTYILTIGPLGFDEDYILAINSSLIIFYLGYHGLFQSSIFIPSYLIDNKELTLDTNSKLTEKPKKEIFTQSEIIEIKNRLKDVLEYQKLYLNDSLTLADLASKISITDKKLSIFINQHLQTSFYELINYHRIEAFKKRITSNSDKNFTLWGVASECGFKSKTSFHRIFKKQIGLTPLQYQKNQSHIKE
ncbi:AraC-like DNA-binding protein [Aquimarina sp. MAR_2010_214]|uniref:helix-turn-helix domain-containing protein n=1 Tax=Aquimarina sp. MAR_2010_214 TaxID=1250026 RepID=UPI000C6FE27A|nr:helix-turn-helix domain-containing protein [Aquimarina sp. MAR_2010_214]PKV50260.1 AraC-like DNA-binding protein [Aquimarina sp. MAR_2010_214]